MFWFTCFLRGIILRYSRWWYWPLPNFLIFSYVGVINTQNNCKIFRASFEYIRRYCSFNIEPGHRIFSKIEDIGFSDPNFGNQHQVPMEMFVYSKNMYNSNTKNAIALVGPDCWKKIWHQKRKLFWFCTIFLPNFLKSATCTQNTFFFWVISTLNTLHKCSQNSGWVLLIS